MGDRKTGYWLTWKVFVALHVGPSDSSPESMVKSTMWGPQTLCLLVCKPHEYYSIVIVELRTPATPVGVGGGKERGGCHLNLRT